MAAAPRTVPLVFESRDWRHGVFIGATMGSEKTAAAFGGLGELRHDPFAMLPFCGYHMGDYFAHWLSMTERTDESKLPRIYGVNWFRKDEDGKFLWPGYGENSRVLEWICRRLEGEAGGEDTPIGAVPQPRGPRPRGPGREPVERTQPRSPSIPTSGAASCRRSRSTSTASATSCRPSCAASSTPSSNASADELRLHPGDGSRSSPLRSRHVDGDVKRGSAWPSPRTS